MLRRLTGEAGAAAGLAFTAFSGWSDGESEVMAKFSSGVVWGSFRLVGSTSGGKSLGLPASVLSRLASREATASLASLTFRGDLPLGVISIALLIVVVPVRAALD
jgi:hypothetical protein